MTQRDLSLHIQTKNNLHPAFIKKMICIQPKEGVDLLVNKDVTKLTHGKPVTVGAIQPKEDVDLLVNNDVTKMTHGKLVTVGAIQRLCPKLLI